MNTSELEQEPKPLSFSTITIGSHLEPLFPSTMANNRYVDFEELAKGGISTKSFLDNFDQIPIVVVDDSSTSDDCDSWDGETSAFLEEVRELEEKCRIIEVKKFGDFRPRKKFPHTNTLLQWAEYHALRQTLQRFPNSRTALTVLITTLMTKMPCWLLF
jgi:hypothetical protein